MTDRVGSFLINFAIVAVALMATANNVRGQTVDKKSDDKEPGGSITGRVTRDGNPVVGAVVVLLVGTSHGSQDEGALARVRTDQDGRYRIADVASGTYRVNALLPAYVEVEVGGNSVGSVRVPSGGEVSGVDFSLVRGGVITGRVTDQSGAPLSRQAVNLYSIDDQGRARQMFGQLTGSYTDDRGIYRIYGLEPGTYIASVRIDPKQNGLMGSSGFYREVFWPGTGEQSKARRIKVISGSEETGVDISIGPLSTLHFAAGRIVNAESGSPMPNQRYGLGQFRIGAQSVSHYSTDGAGRFRIEGLGQGKYSVSAEALGESGLYSDTEAFEISDDDVTGLEVRVHRGATVAGNVVLEGVDDPTVAARLSQVDLLASLWSSNYSMDNSASTRWARIHPDGSFRFVGLRPGRFYIGLGTKGLSLKSVQGQGVQDPPPGQGGPRQLIDVGEGQALTGLQVVLSAASGVIKGQIRVEGGELPRGGWISVSVSREGESFSHSPIEVDGNFRFIIDELEPGTYRIHVDAYPRVPIPGRGYGPLVSSTEAVTVSNAAEASVVVILDLSEKDKKNQ